MTITGRHHQEIQFDKQTSHWHIPIIDRNDTWFCVDLGRVPEDLGKDPDEDLYFDVINNLNLNQGHNEYEWNDDEIPQPEVNCENEKDQTLYEWKEEELGERR